MLGGALPVGRQGNISFFLDDFLALFFLTLRRENI